MKNSFIFFLVACWIFSLTPVRAEEPPRLGLFVSVIQNPPVLSSRAQISELIRFAKETHIDTLFVQIYRANQAWFPSKFADSKPYELALKRIGEDPFKLLIKEAHQEGIKVHAWLNLLSLSTNTDAPILKKYGTDVLTRNLKSKHTLSDYKIDNQYFLEPGDSRVRQELMAIVDEILAAYPDMDGIQFDYIRYPDKYPHYGFTRENVDRFKKATGLTVVLEKSSVWHDWKRRQVTELLETLINRVRAVPRRIQVSTTGCSPYIRAYEEAFQDWPSWIKRGLVDFVTVMSYSDQFPDFEKEIAGAKAKTSDFRKINVGVGAYKLVGNPQMFSRQLKACQDSACRACIIFHYGSLLEDPHLGRILLQRTSSSKN